MSTEKATNGSRASACYAAAGELFGHLRDSLGFGELVMFTRTWGQSAPTRVMAYQWTFNAKGHRYCCDRSVSFDELELARSMKSLADHIAEVWKNEHRKTEEQSA